MYVYIYIYMYIPHSHVYLSPLTLFLTPPPMVDRQSETRRKSMGKLSTTTGDEDQALITYLSLAAPCGACKFLRRKCVTGCIFAPHFGSDRRSSSWFAAVHKVFGASNVSRLLLHIPVNSRHDAVVTLSYESRARLSDPVYGCVSTILALQQQVFFFFWFISCAWVVICLLVKN